MGNLVFAGIAPHPPIIIGEIGGAADSLIVEKTINAMKVWAQKLKATDPEVLIVFTPHGNVFRDAIAIHGFSEMKGDFSNFGVAGVSHVFSNHLGLQELIVTEAEKKGFQVLVVDEKVAEKYGLKMELDHGVLVPLDFIVKENFQIPIVVISTALLDYHELYDFGCVVEEAFGQTSLRIAVVASADLSHRLTKNAPAGYDEMGKEFDSRVVEIVETGNLKKLLDLDEKLIIRAGECGFRPMLMLAGVLDSYSVQLDFKSYEGPFGVGYLVASFDVEKSTDACMHCCQPKESVFVQLARESIEYYLQNKEYLPVSALLPPALKSKKACFVSLKRDGHLRGCIGTLEPMCDTLAEEIIKNSVSAAFEDYRFLPVTDDEFSRITISVDVLSTPEKIASKDELDPTIYGLIISNEKKAGVLLPNLQGVDDVNQQVQVVLDKAGIRAGEKYEMYRFKVERYY